MLEMVVRRLLQAILTLIVLSFITFSGIFMIGNPMEVLADESATAAQIQAATERFGLDQPLHVQYFRYLGRILQGDLGVSYVSSLPVSTLILQRLPATLEITVASILLSIGIGLPLGVIAGVFHDSRFSRASSVISILGFSLPNFWFGLSLLLIFAVYIPVLPSIGRGDTVEIGGVAWSFLTLDGLQHLILPSLTLAVGNMALLFRLAKSGMQEVMMLDYIRLARIKGLRPAPHCHRSCLAQRAYSAGDGDRT